MHKGGHLRVVYVILGYTPSTKWFQSPKNVIRARDSRLALIDMAVLGFRTLSYRSLSYQTYLFPRANSPLERGRQRIHI